MAKRLIHPALWFCACNFLATTLAAQCSNPTPVPSGTFTAGDHSQVDNNALSATNFSISGSATATFVAGNCIQLMPGFHAKAGTASTTFHAWVESTPSAVSVSPSNGYGLTQQFSWTALSPSGYGNLADIFVLFNASISGQNACYVHYNQNANLLYLADNTGSAWGTGVAPQSVGTVGNSQCSIDASKSTVLRNGNQLTLNIPISFQSTFTGTQNQYMIAYDQAGLTSGWQQLGSWTPVPPDFSLLVAPTSATVIAGAPATYTVTILPVSGFSGAVTLSASGLPVGATAAFSPAIVIPSGNSATTATVTINTVISGATGNYTIAITGTSGSLVHAGSASLAIQDFAITVSTSSPSVAPWGNVALTISATGVNGYSGNIQLAQVIQAEPPSGALVSSSGFPGSITAGTQFQYAIQPNSVLGQYTLQIRGFVGNVNHYATLWLTVTNSGDFTITVSGAQTVTASQSATYSISVAPTNGFNGAVNLGAAGLPSGIGATLSSSSIVGTGSSTLTLATAANVAPGTYQVGVIATIPGGVSHTTFVSLIVAAGPDYTITLLPPSQTVGQGASTMYTVQTNPIGGFSGNISFATGALPPGMSAVFNTTSVPAGQSAALTIATSGTVASGVYSIPIYATAGRLSRRSAAVLIVGAPSPATMLTPGNGAIITSSTATFSWTPGVSVSQYQLSLGSSPGAADLFSQQQGPAPSAYCPDGTLQCHSVAVNIPAVGQPQTIYAILSSFIAGTWQTVNYSYRIGLAAPSGSPSAMSSAPAGSPVVNNNQTTRVGPLQLLTCTAPGVNCVPDDAGRVRNCKVSGDSVIAGATSVPSSGYPDDYSTFDVDITASYSASPGQRTLTCGVLGSNSVQAVFSVYDATPQITYVDQYPPNPDGSFYISVYGTNFGPQPGTLSVCGPTASDCASGTPDIAVDMNAPYAVWSNAQVNALLIPAASAGGDYLVQIGSGGELGSGFVAAPQAQTGARSNFGKVTISSGLVTLTVDRQSLLTVVATGSPSGGRFSNQLSPLLAAHQVGIGSPVQIDTANSSSDSSSAIVAFKSPQNPSGAPSQGGIALIDTGYTAPSGASALKTYSIPTFGMSCYFTALQSDYSCTAATQTVNPPGVQGAFCNTFLSAVRLQGAGRLNNGSYIKYDKPTKSFYTTTQLQGADGPLIAGQTVARDYAIIPKSSGTQITLDQPVGGVTATDTGSLSSSTGTYDLIAGYRLDLFNGSGKGVCANYPAPILVGACSPALAACPGLVIQ